MKPMFLLIASLLASQSAFAIHGDDVMEADLAQRTCAIYSRNSKTKEVLSMCTANLLTPSVMLSAAHCVLNQKSLDFLYRAKQLKEPTQEEDVESAVLCGDEKKARWIIESKAHPNFLLNSPFPIGDIGIFKINKTTGFDVKESIPLARTPEQAYKLVKRGDCRVVGYGINDEVNPSPQPKLHMTVPQLSVDEFAKAGMGDFITIGTGKNTTKFAYDHGDSGGALYCRDEDKRWVLVSINAIILAGQLPLATAVSRYIPFIEENLN